jgi:hypothetical protein
MPGSVQNAVPATVFPNLLSRAFIHSRHYELLENTYRNGESQRTLLPADSRKRWRLAKRLSPAQMSTLRAFYDARSGPHEVFYFYDPYDTSPQFSYDGSGLGLSGSGVLAFGVIGSGAIGSQTFALVGAVAGQQVVPAWPATLEAGLSGRMAVSANDVIQVRLLNASGADITPAAQTFGARVGSAIAAGAEVGRYVVRFDGEWSQAMSLGRGDVGVELVQVA